MVRYERVVDFLRHFEAAGGEQRDSVHVDELGDSLPDAKWVDMAIATFVSAMAAQDALSPHVTIAMEIFLTMRRRATAVDFKSLDDLETQLSHTPPELILYRQAALPRWDDDAFRDVTEIFAPDLQVPSRILLQEWLSDDEPGLFDRRLWLVCERGGLLAAEETG